MHVPKDDNLDQLLEDITNLCLTRNLRLSTAESCTGGMLGALLTRRAGSSRIYLGGIVAYANELKERLLNIPGDELSLHGAVSEETALAMAQNVRRLTNADYGLSITGIAGPSGGTQEKPVGTVWCGCSHQNKSLARVFFFQGEREHIRQASSYACLELLKALILEITDGPMA